MALSDRRSKLMTGLLMAASALAGSLVTSVTLAGNPMLALVLFLAVGFPAACLWLSVRIFNRRERWAKRTLAALIGLPVLYILSFGPACWWLSWNVEEMSGKLIVKQAPRFYRPIGWVARRTPRPVGVAIGWYATLGIADEVAIHCAMDGDFVPVFHR